MVDVQLSTLKMTCKKGEVCTFLAFLAEGHQISADANVFERAMWTNGVYQASL